MDFTMSARQQEWQERVRSFMQKHVRPAVPIYKQQDAEGEEQEGHGLGALRRLRADADIVERAARLQRPGRHERGQAKRRGRKRQQGRSGKPSYAHECSCPNCRTLAGAVLRQLKSSRR